MSTFDFLWQLVANHGGVAENYKAELARVWAEYSLEEQRHIYRSIRDKLRADKFVNYNPVKAVRENAPKAKPPQVLSFAEYYKQYGTTEEVGGWVRKEWKAAGYKFNGKKYCTLRGFAFARLYKEYF